jgi:hypothetical protein
MSMWLCRVHSSIQNIQVSNDHWLETHQLEVYVLMYVLLYVSAQGLLSAPHAPLGILPLVKVIAEILSLLSSNFTFLSIRIHDYFDEL